jgi:hypothetical protein
MSLKMNYLIKKKKKIHQIKKYYKIKELKLGSK